MQRLFNGDLRGTVKKHRSHNSARVTGRRCMAVQFDLLQQEQTLKTETQSDTILRTI